MAYDTKFPKRREKKQSWEVGNEQIDKEIAKTDSYFEEGDKEEDRKIENDGLYEEEDEEGEEEEAY